jgi:hypothetical protein
MRLYDDIHQYHKGGMMLVYLPQVRKILEVDEIGWHDYGDPETGKSIYKMELIHGGNTVVLPLHFAEDEIDEISRQVALAFGVGGNIVEIDTREFANALETTC